MLETAEIVAEAAHASLCGLLGHHGKRWVWLSELDAFASREGAPLPSKHVVLAPGAPSLSLDVVAEEKVAPVAKAAKLAAVSTAAPGVCIQHVHQQLEALREGNFASAFALNSAANCARLGSAAAFEQIVRGSPAFRVLLEPAERCGLGVVCEADELGARPVSVRVSAAPHGGGEEVRFAFDLRRGEAGRWETDGVRIEC